MMNLIDLFSGCGGFSLGAHRAGFRVAAAFDNDRILSSAYPFNFPDTKMILHDVSYLNGDTVRAAAGGQVDGIFGGPPCQGFSDIGRRRSDDPRRQLIGHFYRIVSEVKPKFFIMENVRGLVYSDARHVLDKALLLVRDEYAILGPHIWDASQFGAATKRPRLFVVGIHKDFADPLTEEDVSVLKRPATTVRAAISDMVDAVELGEEDGFDLWKISRLGRPFEYARKLRSNVCQFTGHRATIHTKQVIGRFEKVAQGGMDPVGRHPRLAWEGQCPTLRAGTGADLGSYQSVRPIHPEEPRVITVREAARLQGFHDSHRFHPSIWHSFRMIGNSVSPIMSSAIFTAIRSKILNSSSFATAAD